MTFLKKLKYSDQEQILMIPMEGVTIKGQEVFLRWL